MRQIILILLAALLVNACGAKGPLYLPDKKYPQPNASQPLDNSQPQAQPNTTSQPQDTHQ